MDYYLEQGWSEAEVDEMISTIAGYASQNAGHTTNAQMLLAGEFPVTLSVYTDSVDSQLRQAPDAPITWRKSDGGHVKPLVYMPQGAVLMKNAPHPAAAMLLIDVLVRGQRILPEEHGTATAVPQPGGPLEGIPAEDLVEADLEIFINERDEWTQRFDELLRQS